MAILADQTEATLKGQAEIWKYMYGFADVMVFKCAVELQLPDIIHSHSGPISLAQIASAIPDCPSPDISCLGRIMRLLVRRRIFTEHQPSDGSEALYGPTDSSRWLLTKTTSPDQLTLAPYIMMNHPWFLAPWDYLSRCVRDGGIGFEKLNGGRQMWEVASENPVFNKLFNEGMACTAKITMRAILSQYRDGFSGIGTLVDVGGGTGGSLSEILKAHPHIKGITYDLPHVVATAPAYPGLSHVGGNMFEWVPNADAVFMKVSM